MCALYKTGQWFTTNAAKHPPTQMQAQAQALGLKPQKNGQLYRHPRAKRLLQLVKFMSPAERAPYLRLAYEHLSSWQAAQGQQSEDEEGAADPNPVSSLLSSPLPAKGEWGVPNLDKDLPSDEQTGTTEEEEAFVLQEATQQAAFLQSNLPSLKVEAEVKAEDISIGPAIVRFGIRLTGKPELQKDEKTGKLVPVIDTYGNIVYRERTPTRKILAIQNDIALLLEAKNLRMEVPVPGRPFVGVEIPRKQSRIVTLREVLRSREYSVARTKSKFPKIVIPLGRDVNNQVRVLDLSNMPHLLIAGATGAGKSVGVVGIIDSILLQSTPEDVRFLMIDPKMVELSGYNGIPHLLMPVVTDAKQAVPLLKNAINEMERRYRLFTDVGVKNLEGYRQKRTKDASLENLPLIVVIIDELADLMMAAADEVEDMICRLAQLARATGIHLVIATQRPSVDVITGLIKANIPARIAYMVSSAVDSRTVIDKGGAEKLLGHGDMLFLPPDSPHPVRVQGAFVTDDFTNVLVDWWRNELIRVKTGGAVLSTPLRVEDLVQMTLDPAWALELQQEGVQPPTKASKMSAKAPALSRSDLMEYLRSYLLYGKVEHASKEFENVPIPIPAITLQDLEHEQQALIAEAVIWKGHRGSATELNRVLHTKQGPSLRNLLIDRGLMDKESQQPIRASEQLLPLLVECGYLDATLLEPQHLLENEDEESSKEALAL